MFWAPVYLLRGIMKFFRKVWVGLDWGERGEGEGERRMKENHGGKEREGKEKVDVEVGKKEGRRS